MSKSKRFAHGHRQVSTVARRGITRVLAVLPAVALVGCAFDSLDPPDQTPNAASPFDGGVSSGAATGVPPFGEPGMGTVTAPNPGNPGTQPGQNTGTQGPHTTTDSSSAFGTDTSGGTRSGEGVGPDPTHSSAGQGNTEAGGTLGGDNTDLSDGVDASSNTDDSASGSPTTTTTTNSTSDGVAPDPTADPSNTSDPRNTSDPDPDPTTGDGTTPACPAGLDPCGPDECDYWLDGCISDSDYVRSKTPSDNACDYDCNETPRQCSLSADTFCPSSCMYTTDADCVRPNRLFVTRAGFDGNLGGLTGADAKCQAAASAAGLNGTYVAVLGSSTTKASTRLSGARGFMRVDNAPIADTINDLMSGKVFNAPNVNEYGETMPAETMVAAGFNRTGQAGYVCDDWSSTSSYADFANAGHGGGEWSYVGVSGCAVSLHLYCTETSQQAVVKPIPTAGTRKAFLAAGYDRSSGLSGADARCNAAAQEANVPGTFKALLAAGNQPASARFNLQGAPWARLDGTKIVSKASELTEGRLTSPLNQRADGRYVNQGHAWTGMADVNAAPLESCANWTSGAAPRTGRMGNVTSTGNTFLSEWQSKPCTKTDGYLYCLEETSTGVQPSALPDERANVMFVTSESYNGNLGGPSGADQKCAASASNAGLAGTFVAVLYTPTQNPIQRLGNARGFVRPDGLPIAASPIDLVDGRIMYPPSLDADGNEQSGEVWAGVSGDCRGWTSNSAPTGAGDVGAADGGGASVLSYGTTSCNASNPIYCAETSQRAALPTTSLSNTRMAFLARGSLETYFGYAVDPGVGLASLDAQCQSEASINGLGGTYKALLATTNATPASRFNTNGATYARPDGVVLSDTAAHFFANGPDYPINVAADGVERFGNNGVWLGSTDFQVVGSETCNNWTSRAADQYALSTTAGTAGPISAQTPTSCDSQYLYMICLQN